MIADALLFGIEDVLNAAFESAMDPIVATIKQRDAVNVATVYSTVQTVVSGASGHLGITGTGEKIHDYWNCNVTLSIFTNRLENPSDHNPTLAKLRGILTRPWLYIPDMTHHEILMCKEGSSSVSTEDDLDLDVTQITAEILLGIKPNSLL